MISKNYYNIRRCFFIFLFCLAFLAYGLKPYCVFAVDSSIKKQHENLRAKYLKLRNTDSELIKAAEWNKLARELLRFVDVNPKYKESPSVLLDASILYEKLYDRFGGQDRLLTAAKILDRVARDYPGHMLSDDALIRRADLLLNHLHDLEGAKRSYMEVVQAYPRSDMFPVARARLEKLERGAYDSVPVGANTDAEQFETSLPVTKSGPLIVIDPGHGGEDYGAIGRGGLLEKDVVLAVALELEKVLHEELGAVVRLTRRGDVFVPLMERTALANDFEADLFISIHTNASETKKLSGFEVYYLDNAGDKSSKKLAERENRSMNFGQQGGRNDLQFMLSDLIQNAKLEDSILLAKHLDQSVYRFMGQQWKLGKNLGVKKAPFYVLVGAHMPCVLVELFFIDHVVDGVNLSDPKFRRDAAKGLALGIKDYFEKTSKQLAAK